MPYTDSDSENDYISIKRKPRQQKHRYAYSDYSEIEDSEEETNSHTKKQQKNPRKTRGKKTRKNLTIVCNYYFISNKETIIETR